MVPRSYHGRTMVETVRSARRLWDREGILEESSPQRLYLELLKGVLTRYAFGETKRLIEPAKGTRQRLLYLPVKKLLGALGVQLVRPVRFDRGAREIGIDWPPDAETMIGMTGLDMLEYCATDVLRLKVPGDFIETGVWRGGAAIFMRAVLEAYGDRDRVVWAADSFRGLPKPDPSHDTDVEDALWRYPRLAISLEEVRANFERYGLLDDRVRFLVGWFHETLSTAPIERLALLRLDGDLYESTMVALEALYPKLSGGGYVIVDDYHAVRGCRNAVDEFRARHRITEEIVQTDWARVFWRRER